MHYNKLRPHFRGDIEGLRAIAVILVVAYHCKLPLVSGGYIGVDIFFVISGFVITALLLREREKSGRIGLLRFYARRVRRLFPALFVVAGVTSILSFVLFAPFEQRVVANSLITSTAYASNLFFYLQAVDYLSPDAKLNPFLHTWSLSVEEQFYIVWPLLLMVLLARAGKSKGGGFGRWGWGIMGGIIVASLAASVVVTQRVQPLAFFGMPFRAWEFGLGGIGAVLDHYYRANLGQRVGAFHQRHSFLSHRVFIHALAFTGLGGIFVGAFFFDDTSAFPGYLAAIPVIGTFLVIVQGGHERGLLGWLLASAPMRYVGGRSYSWYLWHWPLIVFAEVLFGGDDPWVLVAAAGLGLLLADLTFRWVEEPVRSGRAFPLDYWPSLKLGLVLSAVVLAGGFGWKKAANYYAQEDDQVTFTRAKETRPIHYAQGCEVSFFTSEPKVCEFGTPGADRVLVLLGDSHAGQWLPALRAGFGEKGWRILVMSKSGCAAPMVDYFFPQVGREYRECDAWRQKALDKIAELRPELTVVGSLVRVPVGAEEWREGVRALLNELSRSSQRTVLLNDTPAPEVDTPVCLARMSWNGMDVGACQGVFDRMRDRPFEVILREEAEREPSVRFVDMNPLICPPDQPCSLTHEGYPKFRDGDHLSVRFAKGLAQALADAIDLQESSRQP